jgi:hypothetical protein
MTLLNSYPRGTAVAPPPEEGFLSRGRIIPGLLHCETLDDAVSGARLLSAEAFPPFRLLLINRTAYQEVRSDGRQVECGDRRPLREPVLFTSSGLGDDVVEPPRRALFEGCFTPAADWVGRQEAFHRHSWPGRREVSVCMSRPEARTVSITVVDLGVREIALTYLPVANDPSAGAGPGVWPEGGRAVAGQDAGPRHEQPVQPHRG